MKTFLALFLLWAFVSSRLALAEKVGVASTAGAPASVSTTAVSGSNRDGGPVKGSIAASVSKSRAGNLVEPLLKDESNDDLSEEYSGEDSEESGESWEVTSAEADSRGSEVARDLGQFSKAKDSAERFGTTSKSRSSSNSRASSTARTRFSETRSKPLPSFFSRSAGSNSNLPPDTLKFLPADSVAQAEAADRYRGRVVADSVWRLENEERNRKLAALEAAKLADRAAKDALGKQRAAREQAVLAQNLNKNATMAQKFAQAATAVMRSAMDKTTEALVRSELLLQEFRKDFEGYVALLARQIAAAQVALEKAGESKLHSMSAQNISIQAARGTAAVMTQMGNRTVVQAEGARRVDKVVATLLAAINRAEAAVETEMRALIEQAQKGSIYFFPFLGTERNP